MLQKQCQSSAAKDIAIKDVAKTLLQKMLFKHCYKICYSKKQPMHLWQISIHQPFFFFVYFFSLVPLQRGQLRVLHSSSSYGVLTRPGQKMMTSAISIVIFWSSYETMAKDNNELTSSSVFFSYIAKDDNDPLDSLPSSTCFH